MLEKVIKTLKPKKSHGIDGIPLCVVKDLHYHFPTAYLKLMNLATKRMPKIWKVARVLPLHKKGSKHHMDNFRPISNLCSIDKLFERIILNNINEKHPNLEGSHQHGFRANHSTVTAMMQLQAGIVEEMERGKPTLVYSVDLSAAFDLLRPRTFLNQLKGTMGDNLLGVVMDFLTGRETTVEISGKRSEVKPLTLGCVQGSVLGPKIFNIYMRSVAEHLRGHKVLAYADDTYVQVTGDNLLSETKLCIESHLDYLSKQGMVTNLAKTEAVIFSSEEEEEKTISVSGETFEIGKTKKVLGVVFDKAKKFDKHIDNVVMKSKKLNSALKVMRKKLTLDQFLKVLTCQFFSKCFYACSVWLNPCKGFKNLRRLNACHYRSLRIAMKDFGRRFSHETLDKLERVRPSTWAKYAFCNLAIKTINTGMPTELAAEMMKNTYRGRRRPGRLKCFDNSLRKIGRQHPRNRLTDLNEVELDIPSSASDDLIRIRLKKLLGMAPQSSQEVFSTG